MTTTSAAVPLVRTCLVALLAGRGYSFVPAPESSPAFRAPCSGRRGRSANADLTTYWPGIVAAPRSSSRRGNIFCTPSLVRCATQISASEGRNVGEAGDGENEGEEDDGPTMLVKPRTKRQVAQLMYVMINDVENLIRSPDHSAAPAKALDNIHRLQYLFDESGDESYRPNSAMYNALVRAHAKSGLDGAAEKAEDVLNYMKDRAAAGENWVKPDVTTYTAVVDAYARSKEESAAVEAERILYGMMDEAEAKAEGAWGEEEAGEGGEEAGPGALGVVLPTSVTCDAVLNAWARRKSREGAEHCERILERMEYLRTNARGGGAVIRPTTYSFATVILAWKSGVGGAEAAERAENILERMIEMSDMADRRKEQREKERSVSEDGDGDDDDGSYEMDGAVRPNVVVFNSVIDSWSRSGSSSAGTRAEELLSKMEEMYRAGNVDVKPDVISYNSVINAWSNCGHMNAAKAAEGVMEKMVAADDDVVRPNARTYNSIIKAWSKSPLPGAPQRAEQIVRSMIDAHAAGDDKVHPDVISFSTVLDAWAKSQEPGKAQRVKIILGDMIEFWMKSGDDAAKPNAYAYNTVLNACAFSAMAPDNEERKSALLIAVSTFNEMRTANFAQPDTVTYGMMLKCTANLVPLGQTRDNMASQLFKKCCEEGLVGDLVLNELKRCVSPNTLHALMDGHTKPRRRTARTAGGESIELTDLPKEWKCNVRDKRRRRKQGNAAAGGYKKRAPKTGSSKKKKMSDDDEEGDANKSQTVRIVETSWQSGRDI